MRFNLTPNAPRSMDIVRETFSGHNDARWRNVPATIDRIDSSDAQKLAHGDEYAGLI